VSQYDLEPLDFTGLKTIPIRERGGKVRVEHFAKPYQKGGVGALLDSLPRALALLFAAPSMLPALTTSLVSAAQSFTSGTSGAAVSIVTTFALALFGYAVARASRASHGVSR